MSRLEVYQIPEANYYPMRISRLKMTEELTVVLGMCTHELTDCILDGATARIQSAISE